jgi:hypothetical protein
MVVVFFRGVPYLALAITTLRPDVTMGLVLFLVVPTPMLAIIHHLHLAQITLAYIPAAPIQ